MPPVRVLLVESACSTPLSLQQHLEQRMAPCRCWIASAPSEALAIARAESVDVAILTLQPSRPQEDSDLLADLMGQDVPTVVMVASEQADLALPLMQQGAADYVIQDGDRHYLQFLPFTLKRVLETHRLQQQLHGCAADREQHQGQEQMNLGQQRVLELLARDRPLSEILTVLIQTLEAQSTAMMGSILLLEGQVLRHGAAPSLPPDLVALIAQHGIPIGPNQGSCGTAAYRREAVVAGDIATDPVWSQHREVPLAYGLRACWSVPIFSATNQVLGTFAMYYPQPHLPTPPEWERVMAVVNLAGLAIERKRTEETLHQYQRIVAQVADGLALVDRHYVYQFVNQIYLDRAGQSYGEIVGHSVGELLGEDTFATVSRPYLDRCFAGETVRFEHWFHYPTCGYRFVAVTYAPYMNGDGEIVGAVVGSRDITDVKQTETALAKEVLWNQTLFDASFDGIVVLNGWGDVVEANSGFVRMLGYSSEEMAHLNVADWDKSCPRDGFQAVAQAHPAHLHQFETRHRRKDGSFYEVEVSCNEVAWEGEQLYFSVCRDITERKQAEAMLQNLVEGAAAITGEDFFPVMADYVATALEVRYVIISHAMSDRYETYVFWADGQLQPNINCPVQHTPCAIAMTEGAYFCTHDLQHQFPESPLLTTLGAESYVGVALTNQQGGVIGSLCVLDDKPFVHPQRASAILRVFAVRIGAEIERQGAINALRQLNQELESRVEQRTAELRQINQDLQQAIAERQRLSDRLTLAIRSGGLGIWELDVVHNQLTWDDRMCELYGRSLSERARTWEEWLNCLHPDDRGGAIAIATQNLDTPGDYEAEFRVVHPDGQIRYIKAYGVIQRNPLGVAQRMIGINFDVTQQKQVKAEQSRLLNVLEASLNELYIFDAATFRFHYANRGALQNLGYGWDMLQTMNLLDIKRDLSPESFQQLITPLLDYRQEKIVFETNHYRADGSAYPVEVHLQLITHQQEHLFLAVVSDISDRRQAEIALRESERRFRAIFNHTFQFTGLLTPEGTLLEVNQTALDFAGVHLLEVIDKPFWDTLWWSRLPQAQAQLKRAIARAAQGEFVRYETEVQGANGSITLDFSLRPLKNDAGEIILLIPEGRDITERKQSEEQLRDLSDRLALAVTSGAIGIWDWDIVHNVLDWDERMYELYGLEPSEFLGIYEAWCSRLYPDDRAGVEEAIQQGLRGDKDYDIEFRVVLPGGTIRFIKACGLVERDEQGHPQRMIGINFDISDRKQAEEQIQQANEQLREANAELARATRLKDEFLASMSHELRTPLNAILGMTEGLQEEVFGTLTERQQKATSTIKRSGQHLLDLINDILDLAKIESGKLDLTIAPTAVVLLCNSSLSFIRQSAYNKQIQISTNIPLEIGEIAVDERRMRQVLINLLSNAVKFTPEGGHITLEVCLERSRWLQFRITDTGIGIASEDMPKLFQSFVQVDSRLNRQHSGTGLGLALVKRIVELHNGWVNVTSQVGAGSCFTVTLPYQAPAHSPPSQMAPSQFHNALEEGGAEAISSPVADRVDGGTHLTPYAIDDATAKPSILVVEDNLANLDTFSNYLTHWGYQILMAKNGREAIAIAQSHQPQLIVMDIQMPEMDGLEATRRIRAMPELARVPIIALTALAMSGDRERCLAAGATDYLTKPVSLKHLASTIDQLLQ